MAAIGSTLVIGSGGLEIGFSGLTNLSTVGDTVEVGIRQNNGTSLPANQMSYTYNGNDYQATGGTFNSEYYYMTTQASCTSDCNRTVRVNLPRGDYWAYCDMTADPGKCSGNPVCDYSSTPISSNACTGWRACSIADQFSFSVRNPPTCSAAGPAVILGTGETALYVTVSDEDGYQNISHIYLGISDCSVNPGEAYHSNFERKLAGYLGSVIYLNNGEVISYNSAMNVGITGCSGGMNGASVWGDPPVYHAVGASMFASPSTSVTGSLRTVIFPVQ